MNDDQNPEEKVPWPGIIALQKCCWFYNRLISDRSGFDAINEWGRTATPEEKKECHKLAESLGFAEGWVFGSWAVHTFFRWLFD